MVVEARQAGEVADADRGEIDMDDDNGSRRRKVDQAEVSAAVERLRRFYKKESQRDELQKQVR